MPRTVDHATPVRRELAAAQRQGEAKTPAGARARKLAKELLATHASELLGPLANYPGARFGGLTLTWQRGYIDTASISCVFYDRTLFCERQIDALACLRDLLAHPSSARLRELAFGQIKRDGADYAPAVRTIAAHRLPALHSLTLGPSSGYGGKIGDVESLWRACPNLETLRFPIASTRGVAFRKISLPRLKVLEIMDPTRDALAAIARARWPALEELTIRPDDSTELDIADLRPLFAARSVPRLRRLRVQSYRPGADTLCEALVDTPLARKLVALEISIADMTDRGAVALAGGKWPKLRSLGLAYNGIKKAGRTALAKMRAEVRLGYQYKRD